MHYRFVSPVVFVSILAAVGCGGTTQSSSERAVDEQGGEAGNDPSGTGGGDTEGVGGSEVGSGGVDSNGGTGVGGSNVTGGTGGGTGGSTVTGGGTGGGTGGSTVTGGGTGGALGLGGSGNAPGGGTGGVDGIGGSAGEPGIGGSAGEPGTGGTGGVVTIPVCEMEPEPGGCTGDIPMYYFEPATGRCEEFSYSGCDGNANRFDTSMLCRDTCGGQPPALCELPQEVGPCDAAMPRYWFDEGTGRCELFSYGGCEGNANSFMSEAECLWTCGSGPQPGCPLAQPAGECSTTGIQCRYDYYNSCLCRSTDPYFCDPVLDCWGTGGAGGASGTGGTGAASAAGGAGGASAGALPPTPSEGGASAAELPSPCENGVCDSIAPPTVILCDCDATGTWVCNWGWI